jgi:hypothetical protein
MLPPAAGGVTVLAAEVSLGPIGKSNGRFPYLPCRSGAFAEFLDFLDKETRVRNQRKVFNGSSRVSLPWTKGEKEDRVRPPVDACTIPWQGDALGSAG